MSISAYDIKGHLLEQESNTPIPYAVVQIVESEQWTTTSKEGIFIFENISLEKVTIIIHTIGKEKYQQTFVTKEIESDLRIKLQTESYKMKEVTVTAKKGRGMATSSTINNTAIQHIQPSTLGDVMQLLPGNLIYNPDLSKKQTISIREIDSDANSAAGTAIIVDGAPISEDANYQTLSTTLVTTPGTSIYNKDNIDTRSLGTGVDLRQVSTDNIESIEVIKGIPSVEYGNLTSGAVIVNTKTGYTPLEVKIKTDPRLKQVYVGKGLQLNKGGVLNGNIEYTNSYTDLRSKYKGFNRLSGQVGYSKVLTPNDKPFTFDTKLSFHQTLDQEKTDPDAMTPEEVLKSSESFLRLNIQGKWALNNKFISNLKYNFSGSIKSQEDYEKKYRNDFIPKISFAKEEGENEGVYLPSEALTELTIKGLPVNIFAKVVANKNLSWQNGLVNNLLLGSDYYLSGNYGEGSIYDITNPPYIREKSTRPRSFKDIPASHSISVFIEDKFTLPLGQTTLDIQAGIRANNFQPTSLTSGDIGMYYEPRLNLRYKLIDNPKKLIKRLNIHTGYGINYKTPSLIFLYPDLAYFDITSLDHYSETDDAATYFTTKIYDTSNDDIKPSKNIKKELGFDFKVGAVTGSITAFKEDLSDGLGLLNQYNFEEYNVYDDSSTPIGEKPDIKDLPSHVDTFITYYNRPVNNKASQKEGIEYSFSFGKIKAISTQVMMNGAWMRTTRNYSTTSYDYLPESNAAGQYPQVGIYPAGQGQVSERLNTTFRFVTHSSRLRLVFTTTVQVTWMDKTRWTSYDESPIYLYDITGERIPFTDEMKSDITYKDYVKTTGTNYFMEEAYPPLVLCNFKLSKELSPHIKFSFYANNILNHRPIYQSERTQDYTRRNPMLYFGAQLNMTF